MTAFDGTKTHTYSYYAGSWGDLLQYYDQQEIIYDKMGNPTSYYNGTRWEFTWQNGRELTRATKTGTEVNYTYDADGMRKTKTVNGVPHTYYYNGGTLLREVYGDTILDFFYNANGTPIAMRQSAIGSTNYTIYYYITNLQGDVIRLVDHLGQTAAYYRYDPYGKVIEASGSHANINPLRYRGYYYDVETELYYLQSRYYDPAIGRFINADAYTSTGQGLLGNNMFAYCLNNPIMYLDVTGTRVRAANISEVCLQSDTKKDEEENIIEQLLKAVTDERAEGGTFSFGITTSSSWGGAGGGWTGGVSVDKSYNYAIQTTDSLGTSTGSGVSCGISFTFTNAKNVQDLTGASNSRGFTVCEIIGISIDFIDFVPSSDPTTTNFGICVSLLLGAELEAHISSSYTTGGASWNPWKELLNVWFGG